MQRRPLENYSDVPMREIQFGKQITPPDDMEVLPEDSKYFMYFVTEVPDILGSERYFPSAITTIFKQSVNQPVLRHSILAVSSWMVDNQQGNTPPYTLNHLRKILPGVQKAIIESNITEAHILSVSFLAWLSLMTGDLCTTHHRLKGLFLMFLQARHLTVSGEPRNNPDPIMMFLYRLSIKIDNTLAYRNFPQAYPPITNHDRYHLQWLPHFIQDQKDIDDCLASFKLDDFTNRVCHLHHQARRLPIRNGSIESEIQDRAKSIALEHAAWSSLPNVKSHTLVEEIFPVFAGPQDVEAHQFLHYPAYRIIDSNFAQMMLIHASLGIHLSIVITNKLGPYPHNRYEFAVQVCRLYAALGTLPSIQKTGQSRIINALWLAGLVFANNCYPAGMSIL
jgi:hypothetical protein